MGAWASGTAIPHVLLVAEIADLACNFMEGNHLAVGAALAAKYLSRLDALQESGDLVLTERELSLLKKGLVANSVKKFYDTYNDSVKHFMPETEPASLRSPLQASPLEAVDTWPPGLSLGDVTEAVASLSAGVMAVPQMQGWEILTVMSAGAVSMDHAPSNGVIFQDAAVGLLLYAADTDSPVLSTADAATLFRIRNLSGRAAAFHQYAVDGAAESTTLSFVAGSNTLAVDRDGDGQADDFIHPQATAIYGFLAADLDLDGIVGLEDGVLALRVAAGLPVSSERHRMLPWAVDVDGDRRVGVAEALCGLRQVAGLK